MAHARLGPSNHRWPHCPGSVRVEAQYPDIAGAAAIDGTGSHLLLELCLRNNCRAEAYDGHIIGANHEENPSGWMVAPDRIERVQMCLDYISRRVAELKLAYPGTGCTVEVLAESESYPGHRFGRDDWWGTVDITIVVKDHNGLLMFIEVCDYKDGRGWVHSENNSQLLGYMCGKLHKGANPKRPIPVRMSIVQPKTNRAVRYQDANSVELDSQFIALNDAASRTDDPDAPLVAGKHCQWCKHKPNCEAEASQSIGVLIMTTNNISPSNGNSLFELVNEMLGDITAVPADKLIRLADAREGIVAVFDKVEAEIQRRIESGDSVEGYAMLPGNGSNRWSAEEEEIVKMLKARRLKNEDIYPKKLISPAQVLKLGTLTKEQKEKIQKQYIIYVPSNKMMLTKVRRQREADDPAKLFADVVTPLTVSFI